MNSDNSLSSTLEALLFTVSGNVNIAIEDMGVIAPIDKDVLSKAGELDFKDSFLDGLQHGQNYLLKWSAASVTDPDIRGMVKILPLSQIIQDWEGIVYFSDTDKDDPIRNFYPVDFFVDEACVGIYAGSDQTTSLYLYDFQEAPYRLDLDMEGYLKMILLSRGFFYWQDAIRAIRSGADNPQSERFKKYMPELFPDFKFEDFVATYEQLRLSK